MAPLEEEESLDDKDLVFCPEERRGPTFEKSLLRSHHWGSGITEYTLSDLPPQPPTSLFIGGHRHGLNCVW